MHLVVANWKMHFTEAEAVAFVHSFNRAGRVPSRVAFWIAAPFTALSGLGQAMQSLEYKLGAQNIHWADKGAFTGEISASMLKESGCSFAIVGHSERRHLMEESVAQTVSRALNGLRQGLKIIFCVGETAQQKEHGETEKILTSQLSPLVAELDQNLFQHLIIAYEPVWAIGTGKTPTPSEISTAHKYIKRLCAPNLNVPVLYGGSVSPENARTILEIPEVSGALVGGASLDQIKIRQIIQAASESQS